MPMRVLDSKLAEDRAVAAQAPLLVDYASAQSKQRSCCVIRETLFYRLAAFRRCCAGLMRWALRMMWIPASSAASTISMPRQTPVPCDPGSNDTVWEFVSSDIGAQSTVLAGGRYDGLFSIFGAKEPVPVCPAVLWLGTLSFGQAVGWAAGVERLELLQQLQTRPLTTYDVCIVEVRLASIMLPRAHTARRAEARTRPQPRHSCACS
jgi:histidyl-tRNA synthetase